MQCSDPSALIGEICGSNAFSGITEGIGTTRVTANLEGTPLDDAVQIEDRTCVAMVYRLLREEGLFVGGSGGINAAAAVQVARRLGPGHTVVTLLCDRGGLYFKRLFNPDWLREKGLAAGDGDPGARPAGAGCGAAAVSGRRLP